MDFRVTYSIFTPDSIEAGEAAENGFISEGCSLREAIRLVGGCAFWADVCSATIENPPRWFTNAEYSEDFRTGLSEHRSLHLPDHISPHSAMRIARLLGAK